MIRALEETEIEGVKTTIPADLAILRHPDFIAAEHSTKWVEDRLDLSGSRPTAPVVPAAATAAGQGPARRGRRGRRAALPRPGCGCPPTMPRRSPWRAPAVAPAPPAPRPAAAASATAAARSGSGSVTVPMQGTIIKVLVAVGDEVEVGQTVAILEAMKMENAIAAERAGTVTEVRVAPGDTVGAGDTVVVIG